MSILVSGDSARKSQHQKHISFGSKTAFPLAVPDYIQADWFIARPKPCPNNGTGRLKRGRRRVGGLHWAIHQAVIIQKTSTVILADVVLAQAVWGSDKSDWPHNWRRRLVHRLKQVALSELALSKVVHREVDLGERVCPACCALYGTHTRHQHLEITISTPAAYSDVGKGQETENLRTFLGALEVFGYEDFPDRAYHWVPRPLSAESEEEEAGDNEAHNQLLAKIKALKKTGRLTAIYFPLKLFGTSPRVGLSFRQVQLHQAITRELTRSKRKVRSARPDKAEIVVGGALNNGIVALPYLEKDGRFVGFNGNGGRKKQHLRGRGYKLAVWMRKAAYEILEEGKSDWRQVRRFLADLCRIADLFGLVVGAWHPKACVLRWTPFFGQQNPESK